MYALKKDGSSWRAINSSDEVGSDETFSETQPVLATMAIPNVPGFVAAIKAQIGIVVAASITGSALMFAALQTGQWSDASALIENALTLTQITSAQHSAIKATALTFNVPLTLS